MVKAQEWLENNYSNKETTTKIKRTHFTEILEGELVIENFPNLQKINISSFRKGKLTKLKIVNCPQLRKLNCENNQLEELEIDETSRQQLQKIKGWKGNAQRWLDKNYPNEEYINEDGDKINKRSEISEIRLTEPSLEGELDLRDFTYDGLWGVKVYISPQVNEYKLTFKNLPIMAEIIPVIAQRYIDYYYPTQEERKKITKLDIREKKLTGELDLSDFINLKELICFRNNLTSLNLSNCSQLEEINCFDNLLTNIALPTNPINLKRLKLSYNNFPTQDLFFLEKATNLEDLELGHGSSDGSLRRKISQGIYNRFTGSLDYLSGMEKLWYLDIRDTDINELDLDKLPRSLKCIRHSTEERPDCKLTKIIPLLEKVKFYFCQKCQQPNTSESWCQPCAEKEWKQDLEHLTGQELIEKFIEKQSTDRWGEKNKNKLQWIPYQQFTDIEYLAEGGFSKIYKAKWGKWGYNGSDRIVVLKSLINSQNITLEFLKEIANTKLVDNYGNSNIAECHGISQDPKTKNYMTVMKYMDEGNLRDYLKNNYNRLNERNKEPKLSLKNKLNKLDGIAIGLKIIHDQNLIHRDFHSGNILNINIRDSDNHTSLITDLGLACLVNSQKQEGQIFGVLPYVAPEVLQGQPYTKTADIYSFGIIAYELLANNYPYYETELKDLSETNLTMKIIRGSRPNIDKVPIPQKMKDLIKQCWDANPEKRPSASELRVFDSRGYEDKEEEEYNTFSLNTPYQTHPQAITTSKLINTKQITQLLQQIDSGLISLNLDNLNLEGTPEQTSQIEIPPKK